MSAESVLTLQQASPLHVPTLNHVPNNNSITHTAYFSKHQFSALAKKMKEGRRLGTG